VSLSLRAEKRRQDALVPQRWDCSCDLVRAIGQRRDTAYVGPTVSDAAVKHLVWDVLLAEDSCVSRQLVGHSGEQHVKSAECGLSDAVFGAESDVRP